MFSKAFSEAFNHRIVWKRVELSRIKFRKSCLKTGLQVKKIPVHVLQLLTEPGGRQNVDSSEYSLLYILSNGSRK